MGPAAIAAFAVATLLAVPAAILPVVLVAAAAIGPAELAESGNAGARAGATLLPTLAWTTSIGGVAALLGWLPGRRLAERASSWRLVAAILPLMLPGWLLFFGFWQAIGPGTALGDLAVREDAVWFARQAALAAGLLAACWPLAAWSVALERKFRGRSTAALAAIDGAAWHRRLALAWREDRAALLRGGLAAMMLLWSTTVAFDLAGVRTFGFELRTLDAEGVAPGTILAIGWPGLLPGIVLVVLAATLPGGSEQSSESPPARRRGLSLADPLMLLLIALPLGLLGWGLWQEPGVDLSSLRAFAILHGPSVPPTIAIAAAAAGLASILAASSTLVWAFAGRGLRILLGAEILAWAIVAGAPSAVVASGMIELWNRPGLDWVYRSPAMLAIALLARFGVVAAAMAWWISRRAPRDERRLVAIDGPRRLAEVLAAERGRIATASIASFAIVFSLALGEVALSSRLAPPGDAWLATAVLNAVHYQRGETVMIAALALVLVGLGAAWVVRAGLRRFRVLGPTVATLVLLASSWSMPACEREVPAIDDEAGHGSEATLRPVPVVRTVGGQGTVPGRFRTPRAIDFAEGGDGVLVVDRTGRLQRIAVDGADAGRPEAVWPLPEFDMGFPTGITVVADRILVADTHEHRVLVFDAEGGVLETFGGYGTAPGEFVYPTDVVELSDGRMFVGEYGGNDRIQLFDAQRRPLNAFDAVETGVRLRRPQSLAIAEGGRELFVADGCNHRIVVFDLDGTVKRVLGGLGREPGRLAYPYGIALDGRGGLLVAEFGNNRIQRLDPETGASLGCWGGFGETEGQLRYPWSVAVRDGRVAVLDSGNHRIMLLEIDSLIPATDRVRSAP